LYFLAAGGMSAKSGFIQVFGSTAEQESTKFGSGDQAGFDSDSTGLAIGFDGVTSFDFNKIYPKKIFDIIDKMPMSDYKPKTNLSLYSDYDPKNTITGLGFKNKEKALYTINKIKDQPIKYQKNVVSTMIGRAKNHPYKNKDMDQAIKIFEDWLKKNKSHKD
jgi:hypothetical protein